MSLSEPTRTAVLLSTAGVLLIVGVLSSRASWRVGLPVPLLFIVIGLLAGSEGVGGIGFNDYGFAFRAGTVALVLILFAGGLSTPMSAVRAGVRPALVLATVGVLGTAGLAGLCAHALGLPWHQALLFGAVVSSTDAAAVFSVLRGVGLQLKRRVGVTLELESGLNDPMAVILTMALTSAAPEALGWRIFLDVALQLAVGGACGILFGLGGRAALRRLRLPAGGLFPVLTVALSLCAFGVTTLLGGSGFLAVYLAAILIGNADVPFRAGILRVHDSLAWLSQVVMFLMLGLLAFPSKMVPVAGVGIGLGLLLSFVVRPAVVVLCLAPFRYPMREVAYIAWVGLKGAVPIILSTMPVLAGVSGGLELFHLVFFVVVVGALVPGATVPAVTRWLGLLSKKPAPSDVLLEITSTRVLSGDVLPFVVDASTAVAGAAIEDLPLPERSSVMLVVRGDEMLAPRGGTVLRPGDQVYLFCKPEDQALVRLLFGRASED